MLGQSLKARNGGAGPRAAQYSEVVWCPWLELENRSEGFGMLLPGHACAGLGHGQTGPDTTRIRQARHGQAPSMVRPGPPQATIIKNAWAGNVRQGEA